MRVHTKVQTLLGKQSTEVFHLSATQVLLSLLYTGTRQTNDLVLCSVEIFQQGSAQPGHAAEGAGLAEDQELGLSNP